MSAALLDVEGLGYAPEGKRVLAGVSFDVGEGEFVSVLGPNGAGKSTLLKHLNRLLPVREGAVRLRGRSVADYAFRTLARLQSYVPQAKGYIPPYRVAEFLLMNRFPYLQALGAPGPRDRAVVEDALAQVAMTEFRDRFLDTLSGGERQKVFIAAAVVQETDVILLDEPTTFLDPLHAQEIYQLLGRLHAPGGKTIVMVTHDVNAALALSSRLLCLKAGRAVFFGPPADFLAGRILDRLYDTPFRRYECPDDPAGPPAYLPGRSAP
ncbi:MAG TPA: ABC transporter ATP-binding protein [Acidobacteriota bacterium]|nr:ABC transporter ATP-binding protein [Acidobacteriota bacterium]